jgi:hypothetical protein
MYHSLSPVRLFVINGGGKKGFFFCLLIGLSRLMLRYVLRSQLSNSLFFWLFTFPIHASHVQTYVTHFEGCMESQTHVRQRQASRQAGRACG